MRLWHIDLIPYLPVSQLKGQWRELNSIFKKQDKHLLINYIYNYDIFYLKSYSLVVMGEMAKRGYQININNYVKYFSYDKYPEDYVREDWYYLIDAYLNDYDVFRYNRFKEHNNEYLTICYWNLREKYIRGQKDFTDDIWEKLEKFYKEKIK